MIGVVEKNDVIALKKCEVAVIFALIQPHFLTVVCHEVVVAVDGAGAVVDVVDDSVVAVVAKLTLQISAMTRPVFFSRPASIPRKRDGGPINWLAKMIQDISLTHQVNQETSQQCFPR